MIDWNLAATIGAGLFLGGMGLFVLMGLVITLQEWRK
jgi:hypothetical protein